MTKLQYTLNAIAFILLIPFMLIMLVIEGVE